MIGTIGGNPQQDGETSSAQTTAPTTTLQADRRTVADYDAGMTPMAGSETVR